MTEAGEERSLPLLPPPDLKAHSFLFFFRHDVVMLVHATRRSDYFPPKPLCERHCIISRDSPFAPTPFVIRSQLLDVLHALLLGEDEGGGRRRKKKGGGGRLTKSNSFI